MTIEAEDNDEETGDVTDFESILDLCSASTQQLRLPERSSASCVPGSSGNGVWMNTSENGVSSISRRASAAEPRVATGA